MQALQGKVVVVTFWATSCSICVEEMPDFVETYHRYRARGFELIAIAMDYNSPDAVKNFVHDRDLPFPVVLDLTGALARSFNDTIVVPTTFVIDRNGTSVSSTRGALDFSKLRRYLDASLEIYWNQLGVQMNKLGCTVLALLLSFQASCCWSPWTVISLTAPYSCSSTVWEPACR